MSAVIRARVSAVSGLHLLDFGQGVLGGLVGLRAELGLLLGAATGLAGVAFGAGLRGLRLRDPHPGLALDLLDLVRGGFRVGNGARDLGGPVQDGAQLGLLLGQRPLGLTGGLPELREQGTERCPAVGDRPLWHHRVLHPTHGSRAAGGELERPPRSERARPVVPGQLAVPRRCAGTPPVRSIGRPHSCPPAPVGNWHPSEPPFAPPPVGAPLPAGPAARVSCCSSAIASL